MGLIGLITRSGERWGKGGGKVRERRGKGNERWLYKERVRLTPTSRKHCEPKSDYTLLGAVGRAEDNSQ